MSFKLDNGRIFVGGKSLDQHLARVGDTPFFIYDRSKVSAQVAALRDTLPRGVEIHYALKANPMPALVCHMAGMVDGFDVASQEELTVALNSGMTPERISFAGPGKREREIKAAVAAGITLIIESPDQMKFACRYAKELDLPIRFLVRLNPKSSASGAGMRMSGGASQFGLDASEAIVLVREAMRDGARFAGFHIYSGSQNLDGHKIAQAQRIAFECAMEVRDALGIDFTELNLGGGFGVPYFDNQRPLQLEPIAESLGEIREALQERMGDVRLVIELGRYLVAEAGLYVTRVVTRKESRGHVFLITDGGLHHNQAAAGLFGQFLPRNYPIIVHGKLEDCGLEKADIVGCLCTPMDSFGRGIHLPRCEADDLLVLLMSGAYGATASPLNFLSHPHPKEILV